MQHTLSVYNPNHKLQIHATYVHYTVEYTCLLLVSCSIPLKYSAHNLSAVKPNSIPLLRKDSTDLVAISDMCEFHVKKADNINKLEDICS